MNTFRTLAATMTAAAALFVVSSSASAQLTFESESNDTRATASTTLGDSFGIFARGTASGTTDTDFYSFLVLSPGGVSLSLSAYNASFSGLNLALIDSSGTVLRQQNNLSFPVGNGGGFLYGPPSVPGGLAAGTYYARVTSSNAAAQTYQLNIDNASGFFGANAATLAGSGNVPEPGMVALGAGAGAFGLVLFRRRRVSGKAKAARR